MTIEKPVRKFITPTNHNRSNYLQLAQSAGEIALTIAGCDGFASHWLR